MPSGKWVLWSMLTLSFSTGVLDAATYLGLHGVFTANMTGNLILVSLGVTGQASIPVLRAFLALGGFAVGAAAAGRLLRAGATGSSSEARTCAAVLTVGLLLAGSSVALFLGAGNAWLLDSLTVALAFAMGAQAIAARRVGVGDITTVVVTSTLAGLAGENPVTGRSADGALTARRALAVATMGLGAVTGALLMLTSVEVAVAVSALLTLAVAGVLAWHSRPSTRPDAVSSVSWASRAPSIR